MGSTRKKLKKHSEELKKLIKSTPKKKRKEVKNAKTKD